jgi:hypothetical protein
MTTVVLQQEMFMADGGGYSKCAFTFARLAQLRGREGRGVQGRAMGGFGRLWCGGEFARPWRGWWWCCSSKKAAREEEA